MSRTESLYDWEQFPDDTDAKDEEFWVEECKWAEVETVAADLSWNGKPRVGLYIKDDFVNFDRHNYVSISLTKEDVINLRDALSAALDKKVLDG